MSPRTLILIGLIFLAPLGSLVYAQQPQPKASFVASLPGDAMWLVVLRPKQMFDRAESRGKAVIMWMQLAHAEGIVPIPPIRPAMTLLDYLGADPSEVTELAYALQEMVVPKLERQVAEDEPVRLPPQPRGELILLRLAKPIDPMKARQVLHRVKEVPFQGKTYFGQGGDGEQCAMAFPDDHSVVVGSETQVRKFLAGKPTPGRLTKALATITAADDAAILADVRKVAPFLPGPLSLAAKGTEAQVARLVVRTGPQVSASAVVSFANAEAVDEAKGMVTTALEAGKRNLEMEPPLPPTATEETRRLMKGFFGKLRKGLASIALKDEGENGLRIELPASAGIALDEDYGQIVQSDKLKNLKDVQLKLAEVRYRPADPLAAEMQRLLPAATGILNADFQELASAAVAPKVSDIADQSLTLMLLCEAPLPMEVAKKFPLRTQELHSLLGDIAIKPSELANAMTESSWFGYGTMIDVDTVRHVQCKAQGDQATGKVKFKVSIIWEGEFDFSARRGASGWEISEIRLPARGIKLAKGTAGHWKQSAINPQNGNVKPRAVKGTVTIDGKPADLAGLDFFARPYAEFTPGRCDAEGKFEVELAPGKYVVAVRHKSIERREEPDDDTGAKIVEVEVPTKGEAALQIEVSSK